MRVVFRPVRVSRQYSGKCPVCGKPVRRSRTFEATVNPWNTNPDGTTRTELEVRAALAGEAAGYRPDFTHKACKGRL